MDQVVTQLTDCEATGNLTCNSLSDILQTWIQTLVNLGIIMGIDIKLTGE